MDSSGYYNFDAPVGVSARKPVRVLHGTQMGLLCIVDGRLLFSFWAK